MRECYDCGKTLPPGSRFCTVCYDKRLFVCANCCRIDAKGRPVLLGKFRGKYKVQCPDCNGRKWIFDGRAER